MLDNGCKGSYRALRNRSDSQPGKYVLTVCGPDGAEYMETIVRQLHDLYGLDIDEVPMPENEVQETAPSSGAEQAQAGLAADSRPPPPLPQLEPVPGVARHPAPSPGGPPVSLSPCGPQPPRAPEEPERAAAAALDEAEETPPEPRAPEPGPGPEVSSTVGGMTPAGLGIHAGGMTPASGNRVAVAPFPGTSWQRFIDEARRVGLQLKTAEHRYDVEMETAIFHMKAKPIRRRACGHVHHDAGPEPPNHQVARHQPHA